uniref:Uncharacterized protein n=1 Tax=Pyxicephalus adspersus TaxID=30357 RepID=A0AAV3B6V7_PYXAD|nr:TPA: hypothetical protein GDO54_007194 [Pyxicephalus adspersus]
MLPHVCNGKQFIREGYGSPDFALKVGDIPCLIIDTSVCFSALESVAGNQNVNKRTPTHPTMTIGLLPHFQFMLLGGGIQLSKESLPQTSQVSGHHSSYFTLWFFLLTSTLLQLMMGLVNGTNEGHGKTTLWILHFKDSSLKWKNCSFTMGV